MHDRKTFSRDELIELNRITDKLLLESTVQLIKNLEELKRKGLLHARIKDLSAHLAQRMNELSSQNNEMSIEFARCAFLRDLLNNIHLISIDLGI